MKKIEKLHNELSGLTSQDQWKWVVENKELIKSLDLDNDSTYVNFKGDKEGEYSVNLIDWIGWDDGVIYLLKAIGIKGEPV